MGTPEELETRLSAVERDVALLRQQQALTATDAAAARTLATGADHDVSEVRAELRAHTSALNALRETQVESGHQLDRLDNRLDGIDLRLDGWTTGWTSSAASWTAASRASPPGSPRSWTCSTGTPEPVAAATHSGPHERRQDVTTRRPRLSG